MNQIKELEKWVSQRWGHRAVQINYTQNTFHKEDTAPTLEVWIFDGVQEVGTHLSAVEFAKDLPDVITADQIQEFLDAKKAKEEKDTLEKLLLKYQTERSQEDDSQGETEHQNQNETQEQE